MPYLVTLNRPPTILTAVIKAQVPRSDLGRFVPSACGEVWSYFRSAGLSNPGRHIALYGPGSGEVEVGAEVGEPFEGSGRVTCSALPSGLAATTTHFGPYQRLGDAHTAIREWCANRGHEPAGVCWEIYDHWQDRWNTEPSLIRTEVFHLLRTGAN